MEQARYEARLAQRQYDGVDPDNRLVAAASERRWNDKLERVTQLERAHAQAEQQVRWTLTADERAAILELAQELPTIWCAETTTHQERKQLLRMVIASVQLDGVSRVGQIEIQIHWRSGAVTQLSVNRPAPGAGSLKTSEQAVGRVHAMAGQYSYEEIAAQLNQEGLRSAFDRPFTHHQVGYICRRDGLGRGKPHNESKHVES